ncbi:hypothetical protein HD806DRAFT_437874 [Xylariaceae sp. AK1471]|nr:hypothetical protein HD806DRAFT_437874 [Xylariaceae sp. AK1471]
MQTGDVLMNYSPVSESTSVTVSSPSQSPISRQSHNGPSTNSLDGNAAMMDSQRTNELQASRACEKCRASKRKCNKKLPCCDRCRRLNAKCHYVQDTNINSSNPHSAQVIFLQQSHSLASDVLFRGTEPLEGIAASQILSLVSLDTPSGGPRQDCRHSAALYFSFIQPWYAVVHPILFYRKLPSILVTAESRTPPDLDSSPFSHSTMNHQVTNHATQSSHTGTSDLASKELALLVVLMNLTIRMRLTEDGEQHMFDETYRTVKRMLAQLLMGCAHGPRPTVEVVQCGALMALYEYGHGEIETAYQTLGQTAAVARVLGISATQKGHSGMDDIPLTLQEEQRSCLWWGLFILEQFILQDDAMRHLPFVSESPSRMTLLPESPPMTPISITAAHLCPTLSSPPPTLPAARLLTTEVEVGSQILGSFQLSAKTASIFHKALCVDKERQKRPGRGPLVSTFKDLDEEIRMATKNLLEQSVDWETELDCFAMLVSALFVLYTPFLPILERSTPVVIESDPELTVALTALRFACKMSTEISCKINADFEVAPRSPAVLCAPAGATCYLVILAYSSISRIFPEEHDECQEAIAEKFESLLLFSFRWGLAEKMMRQLECRIGLDRKHYLKNTSITPPARGVGYDLPR